MQNKHTAYITKFIYFKQLKLLSDILQTTRNGTLRISRYNLLTLHSVHNLRIMP